MPLRRCATGRIVVYPGLGGAELQPGGATQRSLCGDCRAFDVSGNSIYLAQGFAGPARISKGVLDTLRATPAS